MRLLYRPCKDGLVSPDNQPPNTRGVSCHGGRKAGRDSSHVRPVGQGKGMAMDR